MTNPSETRDSELVRRWQDIRARMEAVPEDTPYIDVFADAVEWAADAIQAADTIDTGEAVLPCDVQLPPATVLRKGVKLSTLHEALRIRCMHASPRVEVPVEEDQVRSIVDWVRKDVLPAYGITLESSDPELHDSARIALEAALTCRAALPHNQGETK